MKIAYLGPEKTFTEKVTKDLFPKDELVPITPIRNVVHSVEAGEVDFGVVPLENFYNGEVRETIDSLAECKSIGIIQEVKMTIVHCFGALENHGEIKKILSKDQALEQCSKYLTSEYPSVQTISTTSTAEAARIIARDKLKDAAAIAPQNALEEAGLKVLNCNLCPNNRTRFVVLSKKPTKSTGDDKTLVVIHPEVDKPGILHGFLKVFAKLKINLEYIQSRPDGKKGYCFYIEFEGHKDDKIIKKALDKVKKFLDSENKYKETIKILGSYPNTHWKK